jgi:hypothetical protein
MIIKKLTAVLTLVALFTLLEVSLSANDPGAHPRLIPLKDFFRNPETAHYTISPDGEHIAFLRPWENRFDFYRRMETFLARHVGSRAETPPA